ncbi:MAG TPA: nickel pincer cofactor biosynthesis protein LarC [Vicinamibacterales bacterium]|nr:nickel pincer cofactor biosynthesis protein LarC [Vicinamibacterales bacterium]
MSRVLYFDCFSGISGDMTLGALIDAGLPLDDLRRALGSLALGDVDLRAEKVLRTGVSATKFSVRETLNPEPGTLNPAPVHAHRHLPKIIKMIDGSSLSAEGRDRAKAMFQRLGEAEAEIHQMPVEKVHLHEVGALDSIIDIVGSVFAMEWAGADRIVCSPLNVGGGMVKSAHGVFPVPAPATVRILGSTPVYSGAVQKELVTPTGALIATTYASSFGPMPAMSVERVGYGAGDRDDPETPNVLRVLIGEETAGLKACTTSESRASEPGVESSVASAPGVVQAFRPAIATGDRVTVIECEIDDMNPQIFGLVMDRLYAAGALEVFYIPVQMKKNRPGTLLTVVVPPALRTAMADVIFRETTTIGLRHYDVDRECLERTLVTVATPIGTARVKVASRGGQVLNATPEFEDCVKLAESSNLPLKEVQAIVMKAYRT